MTTHVVPKTDRSSAWKAFRSRHVGQPLLVHDPLYALTGDVISAVVKFVPGFFTPVEEVFERDLSRSTGFGFVHGIPISGWHEVDEGVPAAALALPAVREPPTAATTEGFESASDRGEIVVGFITGRYQFPPAPSAPRVKVSPPLRAEWDANTVTGRIAAQTDALAVALRDADGRPPAQAAWLDNEEAAEVAATRQKQEAYAMWLVLQTSYQSELKVLREKWGRQVREAGSFPMLPGGRASNVPPGGKGGQGGRKAFIDFFRRWGLEGLQTWDLPLPLNPRVVQAQDGPWPHDCRTGVSVFVPWYILNGTQFDMSALMKRVRITGSPPQLTAWFDHGAQGDNRFSGEIALQQKFWLYRTYVLVLIRRYPAACKRNQVRLDMALAGVLGRGAELVRKLRQSLTRELKKASAL